MMRQFRLALAYVLLAFMLKVWPKPDAEVLQHVLGLAKILERP